MPPTQLLTTLLREAALKWVLAGVVRFAAALVHRRAFRGRSMAAGDSCAAPTSLEISREVEIALERMAGDCPWWVYGE
jgi:hypothetical protein